MRPLRSLSMAAGTGSSKPSSPPSHLQFELDAHKGAVHTAVYNAGASYILTGGADKQIRLTNAKSGAQVKVYSGHGYEVLGIAWFVHSALSRTTVPNPQLRPFCSSYDNTRIASCGGDRSVFLWDVSSGDIIRRFSGHVGKINTVAWNADASVLASGELAVLERAGPGPMAPSRNERLQGTDCRESVRQAPSTHLSGYGMSSKLSMRPLDRAKVSELIWSTTRSLQVAEPHAAPDPGRSARLDHLDPDQEPLGLYGQCRWARPDVRPQDGTAAE